MGEPGGIAFDGWMPACAGMTEMHTHPGSSFPRKIVIPAQAGILGEPGGIAIDGWMPACAGMTEMHKSGYS